MALSSPLTLAQFWENVRVREMTLRLHEPVEINRTRNGAVIPASLGDAIWRGSVTIAPDIDAQSVMALEARFALLSRPGMAFLAYDARKPYPASDPDGSTYGASTPTIASINVNGRELAITGLPANYALKAGDLMGVQRGTPTRYYLYRMLEDITANGSGATGEFEVAPILSDSLEAGDSVSFVKPVIKAVFDAPPDYGSGQPVVFPGAQFSFVQTLR